MLHRPSSSDALQAEIKKKNQTLCIKTAHKVPPQKLNVSRLKDTAIRKNHTAKITELLLSGKFSPEPNI